eukprot:TRINITY_DN611_c0_g2_i1.p1 TRINITY_DN611_c0_g2~~TRINITY_DN611_c0_g2_i1.p1  ORF type:complete len:168 (+),score=67.08 TRINITY_DN611_c0_g2_i1:135-638(+)
MIKFNQFNFFLLIIVIISIQLININCDSLGFNDNIEWLNSFEEAKIIAKETNKPIMVLIQRSWCGACKSLKNVFKNSNKLVEKSKDFTMVVVDQDQEPQEQEFKASGEYYPRIFFACSEGIVDIEIYNTRGHLSYRHFYSDENSLLFGMDNALFTLKQKSQKRNEEF